MNIHKEFIKNKKSQVKELKKNFKPDFIKAASFSIGGERRTLSAILKGKSFVLLPLIFRKHYNLEKEYPFLNPPPLAQAIEKWGLDAFFIGTDESLFGGNNSFLSLGKQVTNQIPFYRMDYFIDPVQVYESYAIGADGILIDAKNWQEKNLPDIIMEAMNLAMDIFLEDPPVEKLQLIFQNLGDNFSDVYLLINPELYTGDKDLETLIALCDEKNITYFLYMDNSERMEKLRKTFPQMSGIYFNPGDSQSMEEYVTRVQGFANSVKF